jgi:RNA polymerase sigma factor (sigma-70 family)
MVNDWKVVLGGMRLLLLRRGRTPEDADDLMQEAWLRFAVYEARGQVVCPEAFLTRTVLNLAVSADRARAVRGEEVAVEELALLDASPSIEATVLARERVARLAYCVERLSQKTRAVFIDVRVGGMSFNEAAQVHRLTVRGVEKHVSEATVRLSQWMEGWRT